MEVDKMTDWEKFNHIIFYDIIIKDNISIFIFWFLFMNYTEIFLMNYYHLP